MTRHRFGLGFLAIAVLACSFAHPAVAREAAFLSPGAMGSVGEEAIKVDPKPDIDVGETALNVAKRTSVFFVNQTNIPVKIEKITINNDSYITAETTANDCMKQGSIAPLSRCSVEVSVTPTGAGAWSADVLMTHNGAGRITRARLYGKTSGQGQNDAKSTGLSPSSKEIKPIDFGNVSIGAGKTVRSSLMINDSADPITIYSIDVIEADNGLQRLEQGCAVDMELAPGASCPITLLWIPKDSGPISTDLIIRHSGKLGFAVIPVRGDARGGSELAGGHDDSSTSKGGIPAPPTATELAKQISGRIQPVSDSALVAPAMGTMGSTRTSAGGGGDGRLHLIGTIGDRALVLLPNGQTSVLSVGQDVDTSDGGAKVLAITARSMILAVGEKRISLSLEAASSLVSAASQSSEKSPVKTESKKK